MKTTEAPSAQALQDAHSTFRCSLRNLLRAHDIAASPPWEEAGYGEYARQVDVEGIRKAPIFAFYGARYGGDGRDPYSGEFVTLRSGKGSAEYQTEVVFSEWHRLTYREHLSRTRIAVGAGCVGLTQPETLVVVRSAEQDEIAAQYGERTGPLTWHAQPDQPESFVLKYVSGRGLESFAHDTGTGPVELNNLELPDRLTRLHSGLVAVTAALSGAMPLETRSAQHRVM